MQWFLKSKDNNTVKYVRDSTGKGNYLDTNGNIAIATGSNDNYKVNNIYDMAGNYFEWTLEVIGTSSRVLHGGYYNSIATGSPASYRNNNSPFDSGNNYSSSRLTLVM